jgi:hypothetical protein
MKKLILAFCLLAFSAHAEPTVRRLILLCQMEDPACEPTFKQAWQDFTADPTWTVNGTCHPLAITPQEVWFGMVNAASAYTDLLAEPAHHGIYMGVLTMGKCAKHPN